MSSASSQTVPGAKDGIEVLRTTDATSPSLKSPEDGKLEAVVGDSSFESQSKPKASSSLKALTMPSNRKERVSRKRSK